MSRAGSVVPSRALVVTTIHHPTRALHALAEGAGGHAIPFIVVGDAQTPASFQIIGATYFDLEAQKARLPELAEVLPTSHYARKNLAYLMAAEAGALEIQETDDDCHPRDGFWEAVDDTGVDTAAADAPWFNVYSLFTNRVIWPRGFPLEFVQRPASVVVKRSMARGLVFSGLVDGNPDVDAVYRLTRDLPVRFDERPPIALAPGTWCPFNSQNTIVKREAFPFLYLPSQCSMRVTDIWRSFVMQRCLWEAQGNVVFHAPTVVQERNAHDLLQDFEQEIIGYLANDRIRQALETCSLTKGDLARNLVVCYETLVSIGVLPTSELPILARWCRYLSKLHLA